MIRLDGDSNVIAEQLELLCKNEARATIHGHIQRVGVTSAQDRILSSRYSYDVAVELAMQGKFGNMIILDGDEIEYASLKDVIKQENNQVDTNCEMIQMDRALGICFAD